MPTNNVMEALQLIAVWFGSDLQVENNWDEVTDERVANLTQQWAERKL